MAVAGCSARVRLLSILEHNIIPGKLQPLEELRLYHTAVGSTWVLGAGAPLFVFEQSPLN